MQTSCSYSDSQCTPSPPQFAFLTKYKLYSINNGIYLCSKWNFWTFVRWWGAKLSYWNWNWTKEVGFMRIIVSLYNWNVGMRSDWDKYFREQFNWIFSSWIVRVHEKDLTKFSFKIQNPTIESNLSPWLWDNYSRQSFSHFHQNLTICYSFFRRNIECADMKILVICPNNLKWLLWDRYNRRGYYIFQISAFLD